MLIFYNNLTEVKGKTSVMFFITVNVDERIIF